MHNVHFKAEVPEQEASRTCYMCKRSDFDPLLTIDQTHYLQSDLVMVKCRSCKTAFFLGDDPVVGYDYEGLSKDYWHNYVQNGAGITAMLEPLLAIDRPRKGDLLDIGCGFGFVQHFWEQLGYGEAVGLETSQYGVVGREKLGTNIIHKYYNDADEIHGRKFDYVFSSEVLEHVPDPKAFLTEISQGLSEDGILVLTTPSATAVKPDTEYSTLIATLSPGFHYFISSKEALTTLLEEAGYPHVCVRDGGSRLFAWASHQPLPEIADGFTEWPTYLDYLRNLAKHDDYHIAGGAMYRLLKDSINLGEMERAKEIYPHFETLARDHYDLDFQNVKKSEARRRARTERDNETFPSWMGCGFYFAGLFLKRTGKSRTAQHDLFAAAVDTMTSEMKIASEPVVEIAHFLPFAEECLAEFDSDASIVRFQSLDFRVPIETIVAGDVCVLSIFAPKGEIAPYTIKYIETLKANDISVLACVAVDGPSVKVAANSLDQADAVIVRQNSGYDFGMWADVLRRVPQLSDAQRLIFTNDSVLVIPKLFAPMMDQIRNSESHFVALTEASEPNYHTQSYFFVLQHEAIKHPSVQAFWNGVENMKDKRKVIEAYELTFSNVVSESGDLSVEVLFDHKTMFGGEVGEKLSSWNPTHFFWDRLLDRGLPFVKLELLRDNPMKINLQTASQQLEMYGVDVELLRSHVIQSKKERAALRRASGENNMLSAAMETLREMNRARINVRRKRQGRFLD